MLIGLGSSGVHSNGYSLVRYLVGQSGLDYTAPCPFAADTTLGEALLTPTRIYVKPLMPLIKQRLLKGLVHITGGGFPDNIPRYVRNSLLVPHRNMPDYIFMLSQHSAGPPCGRGGRGHVARAARVPLAAGDRQRRPPYVNNDPCLGFCLESN